MNNHIILITGKSTTGKSASLRNLTTPEKVMYLNTESNKALPFPNKFIPCSAITDPKQIIGAFEHAEALQDECTSIVVDSITYMMDMFESQYVINSSNTMQGWSDYAQFFKKLMQKHIAESTKNVILLAHTLTTLNEAEGFMETAVPIKGALKNQGIESYVSVVISTKRIAIKDLDGFESDLLTITEDEKLDGFKYVFQTRLTPKTINERIRSPMGMWSRAETYIDNDVQLVMDKIDEYYK